MSYNGIGLSTPRGSGTSGHIQANRSNLRRGPRDNFSRDKAADFNDPAGGASAYRAPDQSILEHERKRRIEAQCFELQVQLEDEGLLSAEDVEAQVSALREKLTAEGAGQKQGHIKGHERHELAAAKQKADENLRRALGIKADHVEGLAFNREYQEEQKRVRIAQKEERAKLEVQLKADRERAIREREEQRKRHDDDMARERRMQQDELARGRREHEQRMRDIDRNGLPYDDRRSRSPEG
ncbi:RNA-splicing factor [Rhodosporidiobolus nylandii]